MIMGLATADDFMKATFPMFPRPLVFLKAVTLALGLPDVSRADDAPIDFARQIEPVFARTCLRCLGPVKQKGGIRLDRRDSVLLGGDSGAPALVPGKPDESPLLERVATDDETARMPPKDDRLSLSEIDLLRAWIAAGVPWPETSRTVAPSGEMIVTDDDRAH